MSALRASAPWPSVMHALRSPVVGREDRPAVCDGATCWTYRDLDRRAGGWRDCIASSAADQQIIALHLPHGADMIAALLGTLGAGKAFLALDPAQPPGQRIAQLQEAGATLLLSSASDAASLQAEGWIGQVIDPDEIPSASQTLPMALEVDPDSLACLCFTSGSSGRPKAVAWPQRTLAFAAWTLDAMLSFAPSDRHALLSPLAIAASAAQVFATLAAGASLCLFEARRHSSSELAAWLRRRQITTMQTVPSLFRALAGEASGRDFWPALRAVKLGGESVGAEDAQRFTAVAPATARLINGLGLTEAGFNVCWHVLDRNAHFAGPAMPIGAPPPGVELELADADDVGEIVVRSPFLADGYWRDPNRSVACHRDLPERPGWRELRTGDLGRIGADGQLEYLGRVDDMLKVRGQRVYPAEVEAVLVSLPGVVRAVVLVERESDGPRLWAFVEPRGPAVSVEWIRQRLATMLADASIPSRISMVSTWPRLPGGKIDRRALFASVECAAAQRTMESPPASSDSLERTLLALFHQTLSRHAIGVHDSFFDLGGDSLGAARLFGAIARVFQVELPLAELKSHPSVATLAARIRTGGWTLGQQALALLTPAPVADAVKLFCWPGAGSDVMALADLARHLGPTVALYAIQHRGADGRREYDLSLAAMAARGAALIKQVQPRGPYALCGTSFGGRVALETGALLAARKDAITFLAMLDTYAPGYPPSRKRLSLSRRLRYLLRALKPIGQKDEPGRALLWRGLREHTQRLIARFTIGRPRPEAPPLPIPMRYLYLQEACFRAGRGQRPTPYCGDVHLFRVDTPPPSDLFDLDDYLGWRRWLAGRIISDVIPGRHGAHLREPNVQVLAAKLGAALKNREAGQIAEATWPARERNAA